eukprot:1179110-Prorocentrum_minimum.AAC.1
MGEVSVDVSVDCACNMPALNVRLRTIMLSHIALGCTRQCTRMMGCRECLKETISPVRSED